MATEYGHTQTVQKLVTLGADTEVFDDRCGWRAIMYAAHLGHIEIIQILHSAGAMVRCQNDDWESPLIIAVKSNQAEAVRVLLECGSEVDKVEIYDEWSALHFAAFLGYKSIVLMLLDAKPDVNLQDLSGRSPLLLAAEHGETDIAIALMGAGADPNKRDGNHHTALMTAAENKHYDTAQALLERGTERATSMFWAIRHGHPEIVSIIIGLGFSVNQLYELRIVPTAGYSKLARSISGKYGLCALAEAVSTGNEEIMELLIEAGAQPNFGEDKKKPLTVAVLNQNVDMVQRLVSLGAEVNHADPNSGTALQIAASFHISPDVHSMLKILLRAGADIRIHPPQVTSILDNFPFHAIKPRHRHEVRCGEPACISLLYSAGAPVTATTMSRFLQKRRPKCIPKMVKDALQPSTTLGDACRRIIRECVLRTQKNLIVGVPHLPLPKSVQEYLLFGVQCDPDAHCCRCPNLEGVESVNTRFSC